VKDHSLINSRDAKKVSTDTLLSVEQLTWSVREKTILNQLNFSICQGEFVGLVGPNGSGKSSLLRCLYRKNIPTHGKIYFD